MNMYFSDYMTVLRNDISVTISHVDHSRRCSMLSALIRTVKRSSILHSRHCQEVFLKYFFLIDTLWVDTNSSALYFAAWYSLRCLQNHAWVLLSFRPRFCLLYVIGLQRIIWLAFQLLLTVLNMSLMLKSPDAMATSCVHFTSVASPHLDIFFPDYG